MVSVAILLSTIVLAYFYVVDNYWLSSRLMSRIFQYLLMLQDAKTAWLSLGVCMLAALWRNAAPIFKVVDLLAKPAVVAISAVPILALAAVFVYHNNAFSMDEYAAVFQAKIFAAGRLTAQLPPSLVNWLLPPGFNGAFLVASQTTGRAIEAYWPGFSIILAPFEFLGIPWLCNPCLAGAAIFLIYRISLEVTGDRRAAGWAILFTAASGAFFANAISYYSMQAHLTANLLFAWLLLKPTPSRALCAGVVGSLALVLHNPFPHTMFAVPWIVAIARSRENRPSIVPLMLGYLPLLIFVGLGWLQLRQAVTAGDSGFNVISNNLALVFSFPDKPMIDARIASFAKLWIWAVPGLLLFALIGRLRYGADGNVRLLTQSAVVTFVGYLFFIFDQGHGWGYRYFHSAWGVIPILAGCAMAGRWKSNDRLAAFAGAAAILNLLLVIPFQVIQIDGVISRHAAQLPKPQRPGNNVYFVDASMGFYSADLVQMDPFLRSEDLVLFSRGTELDGKLRQQNWPNAKQVQKGLGMEVWNLGSTDQRQVSQSFHGAKHFELAFTESH